ncbi:hypothetical protein C5U48_14865 [Mycolicibacter virginiensis]|uniref:Low molecular weight antigen MTB12-like C-terminal domain-containing protein n=1 Tax=Mycolicibacter virginiensis TaxID=1795032 RepID=A0A9X7ILW4_9MYCO|nr:hypothetical protein [Mycolicibacter virginiensis]PQM51470.1 hypothetical protein C5U48_14865 [Mycolicibacter virginiensis]
MYRHRSTVAAALAAATVLLSGCSGHQPAEPVAEVPVTSTTVPVQVPSSALPAPEALTDVLYRLSDPEVPGADKLALIEGAKPADAATIDKFATALKDGGYLPLSLEAAALGWSDRSPGNVTADVTVNTANPATGTFFFPMEFTPNHGDWQLSQATAKSLLAFGNARTSSTEPAPPTP